MHEGTMNSPIKMYIASVINTVYLLNNEGFSKEKNLNLDFLGKFYLLFEALS